MSSNLAGIACLAHTLSKGCPEHDVPPVEEAVPVLLETHRAIPAAHLQIADGMRRQYVGIIQQTFTSTVPQKRAARVSCATARLFVPPDMESTSSPKCLAPERKSLHLSVATWATAQEGEERGSEHGRRGWTVAAGEGRGGKARRTKNAADTDHVHV